MAPFRYVLGKFWIWAGVFYIRGVGIRGKGFSDCEGIRAPNLIDVEVEPQVLRRSVFRHVGTAFT